MVGPGVMIDFEDTDNTEPDTRSKSLPTTLPAPATDPVATVTINVIDEDEKPTFGDVSETDGAEANLMRGMVAENAMEAGLNVATYTATDPEGESVSLSLMGDDAGLFELAADTEGDPTVSVRYSPSRRALTSRCRETGIGTTCTK